MKTPYNFETGNEYTASNLEATMQVMASLNTDDPRFVTYRGAQKCGYQVRKGEKSAAKLCRIVIKKQKDKKTGKIVEKKLPKYFHVFHFSQLEKAEDEAA